MGGATMDGTDPFEGLIEVVEGDDKNYPVLLLMLPDGVSPGRWEAVEAWAKTIAEVRRRYPNKQFQFLPHTYADRPNSHISHIEGGTELESILAIPVL